MYEHLDAKIVENQDIVTKNLRMLEENEKLKRELQIEKDVNKKMNKYSESLQKNGQEIKELDKS